MAKNAPPAECLSIFPDRSAPPTGSELERVLGGASRAWVTLVSHIGASHAPVSEEWHHSGARFGWSLRLKRRDRVVVYLTPQEGRFLVGIVLGGKALAAAKAERLPAPVRKAIDEARTYAEGTGVRLPVRDLADLPPIERLAAMKMAAR